MNDDVCIECGKDIYSENAEYDYEFYPFCRKCFLFHWISPEEQADYWRDAGVANGEDES
jgi:endogenous inhibitor of DNA gyrase (YacG/DUF329 family)